MAVADAFVELPIPVSVFSSGILLSRLFGFGWLSSSNSISLSLSETMSSGTRVLVVVVAVSPRRLRLLTASAEFGGCFVFKSMTDESTKPKSSVRMQIHCNLLKF